MSSQGVEYTNLVEAEGGPMGGVGVSSSSSRSVSVRESVASSKSLISGEESDSLDGVECEYETFETEHRESTDDMERSPKWGGVYDIDSEGEDSESTWLGIGVVPSNLPSNFSAVAIGRMGCESGWKRKYKISCGVIEWVVTQLQTEQANRRNEQSCWW